MLAPTATTMLRAGAGRSVGALQPMLMRGAACPYSAGLILTTTSSFSMTAPSKKQQLQSAYAARPLSTSVTTKPTPSSVVAKFRPQPPQRNASSSTRHHQPAAGGTQDAEADANAAAAAAAAQAHAHPEQPALDWNTFFQLRKARRRWQFGFSVVSALGSGFAGAGLLGTGMLDWLVSRIPLDPLITLGGLTLSASALGWLVGPSLGSAVFNTFKNKYKGPMATKESEFFARIKKHRVDPSASSVRNPVPDFYGEKISSVAGYRQWLKDQRAFNKKRTGSV
ncbi:Pam17-domain-containing protein [Canariomyces notabilis]|uniref:Presequence translocated-associated motor subunit PAM17 n=1 Tax=Canariomyces notabilis TaxID=2074819 RepID=A0AAN6TLD6_9PEZI|nr:Pam17-domain-containing protein [Canariomyces arenarius]